MASKTKKLTLYNVTVYLLGDRNRQSLRERVTAAEIEFLRKIHGGAADNVVVTAIHDEPSTDGEAVAARLRALASPKYAEFVDVLIRDMPAVTEDYGGGTPEKIGSVSAATKRVANRASAKKEADDTSGDTVSNDGDTSADDATADTADDTSAADSIL